MPLQMPGPGESLSERYPAVAAEWHADLNGELTAAAARPAGAASPPASRRTARARPQRHRAVHQH